ncbi:MAG: hypothetical protein NTY99_00550 [DPANN group archaeon]|nr:hypothetical protein [DPANN group archaeon]
MANLKDLREAKARAEELLKWEKIAHGVEESIDQFSKRVQSLEHQRSGAREPRAQAGYDMALSEVGKHRAEVERRKSEALGKMREAAHAVLGKIGG